MSELREHRNRWAHQATVSSDDALTVHSIRPSVFWRQSRPPEAEEVEKMKLELQRVRFDEQVRSEKRKIGRHRHRKRGHLHPEALARSRDAPQGRGKWPVSAGRVCG